MAFTDCGVSPTWPITGISASVSRAITSSRRSPPSTFTASAPASFTKRIRIPQRLVHIALIRAKRHVRHQQRPLHAAPHRLRVVQRFVQRQRQRAVVAQHHHRHRIAHQHHVHAGFIHNRPVG